MQPKVPTTPCREGAKDNTPQRIPDAQRGDEEAGSNRTNAHQNGSIHGEKEWRVETEACEKVGDREHDKSAVLQEVRV